VWWQYLAAVAAALGSVTGSAIAIRAIVKHEQATCDARLDAFKEGLEHGEHED
jgi:hypothetical protein